MEFPNGMDLWNWLVRSNPIANAVLGSLNLTDDQRGLIQQALDKRWSGWCASVSAAAPPN
jgi:hypothetical protein